MKVKGNLSESKKWWIGTFIAILGVVAIFFVPEVRNSLGIGIEKTNSSNAASYTITFNANGGIGGNSSQTFMENENKLLNGGIPTRSGYTFLCWNGKPDGSGFYFYNDFYTTISVDFTLYAMWARIVTFNANGGVGAYGPQIFAVNNGISENKVLNGGVPTRSGYTFLRWNTMDDGTGINYYNGEVVTFSDNTMLYAVWKLPNSYTVTFDANGGIGGNGSQTFEVYEGGSDRIPLDGGVPTRSGYTFVRWNSKPNGSGTNYYNGEYTTVSGNGTLYAVWKLN